MKKNLFYIFILILLVLFFAHFMKPKTTGRRGSEISYQFLSDKGYTVVEYMGSNEKIFNSKHIWHSDIEMLTLMTGEYEPFLDEKIVIDSYFITNHGLDDDLDRLLKSMAHGFKTYYPNKTKVFVGRLENKVIGGFSMDYSIGEKVLGDGKRDIDGRTLEEVVGESFPD